MAFGWWLCVIGLVIAVFIAVFLTVGALLPVRVVLTAAPHHCRGHTVQRVFELIGDAMRLPMAGSEGGVAPVVRPLPTIDPTLPVWEEKIPHDTITVSAASPPLYPQLSSHHIKSIIRSAHDSVTAT